MLNEDKSFTIAVLKRDGRSFIKPFNNPKPNTFPFILIIQRCVCIFKASSHQLHGYGDTKGRFS